MTKNLNGIYFLNIINNNQNIDTIAIFTYVNASGTVNNISPSFLVNIWKANEKTSKKAICFKLFKYLNNDTFVRSIIDTIINASVPSNIKLLNGIINVNIINIIKNQFKAVISNIKQEEFDTIINQLKTAIESKDTLITQLNQQIATIQKPIENTKQQPTVANTTKSKETINF